MAYNDKLTGLPNRFSFNTLVEQAIEHLDKDKQKIAVLFADLDMLTSVNDMHGHNMGDAILKQVALILQKHTQDRGVAARFESDKFLLMLPYLTDNMEAIELAENILKEFSHSIHINEQDFFITVSLGLSFYPLCGTDVTTLIKNADLATQESKKAGGDRYTVCTQALIDRVTKELHMSNQLHYAIERNELFLLYQPQVDAKTERIVGVEALLRWKNEEFGLVSPGVFIPLAEKNGLISSIGEWVLKEACRQNKAWQEQGLRPVRVSVNASLDQFYNTDLPAMVQKTLADSSLSAKYLEIEITESVAALDSEYILSVLGKLKENGVFLAMDDFGTEYSSLRRLKIIPIDRLKLDIGFIRGIGANAKDEAILKMITHLAQDFQLTVIAEGVETKEQLHFLKEIGCDEIQGFYYYKPLPPDEITALLRKQN